MIAPCTPIAETRCGLEAAGSPDKSDGLGDIFTRVKFELNPLRRRTVEVSLWIGAKTSLNLPRKTQVEQVLGMEMGELATGYRPCRIAVRSEAGRRLLNVGQSGERLAQLLDRTHR